ncbi:MAG: hypothetical protein ACI85H_001643, partial [Paracoccaceae bacterium]
RLTSWHPTARLFVRLELLTDSFAAADLTTDAKIHICDFDDENERCRSLKVVQCSRNLPVLTPRYITTSTTKGILKAGSPSSKNVQLLSRSDSISVPHDD